MNSEAFTNPVRIAYESFLGSAQEQRPSWDQTAVLYAVFGQNLFKEYTGYSVGYCNANEKFHWKEKGERKDLYVKPLKDNRKMTEIIEDLMG